MVICLTFETPLRQPSPRIDHSSLLFRCSASSSTSRSVRGAVLESAVEVFVGFTTLPRRLPPLRGVTSNDLGGNVIGRNDKGENYIGRGPRANPRSNLTRRCALLIIKRSDQKVARGVPEPRCVCWFGLFLRRDWGDNAISWLARGGNATDSGGCARERFWKMSLETCGVLRYQFRYGPGRDDHGDKRYHKIKMGGVCVSVVSGLVLNPFPSTKQLPLAL